MDFCRLVQPARAARVVANLPYNIGTAILQRLIEQRACITEMFLMLQSEVANRITATTDSPERGYLSVLVEVGGGHAFGVELVGELDLVVSEDIVFDSGRKKLLKIIET